MKRDFKHCFLACEKCRPTISRIKFHTRMIFININIDDIDMCAFNNSPCQTPHRSPINVCHIFISNNKRNLYSVVVCLYLVFRYEFNPKIIFLHWFAFVSRFVDMVKFNLIHLKDKWLKKKTYRMFFSKIKVLINSKVNESHRCLNFPSCCSNNSLIFGW